LQVQIKDEWQLNWLLGLFFARHFVLVAPANAVAVGVALISGGHPTIAIPSLVPAQMTLKQWIYALQPWRMISCKPAATSLSHRRRAYQFLNAKYWVSNLVIFPYLRRKSNANQPDVPFWAAKRWHRQH
jgi:hypothetical protein